MFYSKAFAAENASSSSMIAGFVPLILIFIVFYFLIIRPQQKKLKEHNKLLDAIKRGDKIVTSGGIMGVVSKIDTANSTFSVEIAPKVEIKVLKTAISEILGKEPNTNRNKKINKQDQSKSNENKLKDKEEKEDSEEKSI
ncbi:preprotein translocase subunit YajC [Candidatus Mesenet endosymbiont of Agriotes lineatus]|uniref:preprotein translocase subunit YajC n=1 Tax=Candidatus Mesenet endosymbiont of Agriotes lineatus TaxID=3077948 RepID=UPI0030CE7A3E